jgi:hypothetical protein
VSESPGGRCAGYLGLPGAAQVAFPIFRSSFYRQCSELLPCIPELILCLPQSPQLSSPTSIPSKNSLSSPFKSHSHQEPGPAIPGLQRASEKQVSLCFPNCLSCFSANCAALASQHCPLSKGSSCFELEEFGESILILLPQCICFQPKEASR